MVAFNSRKLPRSRASIIILLITIASLGCRGSDVRAWAKTSGPTMRSARDRKGGRHRDPLLLAAVQNRIGNIPRGGDGNERDGDDGDAAGESDDSVVSSPPSGFEILDETMVYSGWRTILRRRVRMRNGKTADFDLVGVKTGEGAVLVFAWDTKSKTATVIREYMPASNRILWGLAAGLIEDKHGHETELAARHELEEECHLKGGTWIPLLTRPAAMDKYALTTIQVYLVLDPEPETDPKPLDDEEDIEIVSGVTIPEILKHIGNGEMNLVGGYGSLLAIEKLRELGEYPCDEEL